MSIISIADLCRQGFDIQQPIERIVQYKGKNEHAIEGVTTTNDLHKIGYTFFYSLGIIHIHYYDTEHKKDVIILEQRMKGTDEFESKLRQADNKIRAYKLVT